MKIAKSFFGGILIKDEHHATRHLRVCGYSPAVLPELGEAANGKKCLVA